MIAIISQDCENAKSPQGDQIPKNVVRRVRPQVLLVLRENTAKPFPFKVRLWKKKVHLTPVRIRDHRVHVDRCQPTSADGPVSIIHIQSIESTLPGPKDSPQIGTTEGPYYTYAEWHFPMNIISVKSEIPSLSITYSQDFLHV